VCRKLPQRTGPAFSDGFTRIETAEALLHAKAKFSATPPFTLPGNTIGQASPPELPIYVAEKLFLVVPRLPFGKQIV